MQKRKLNEVSRLQEFKDRLKMLRKEKKLTERKTIRVAKRKL